MSSVIHALWELDLSEYDLGKSSTLQQVIKLLREVKAEMVVEREARINKMLEETAREMIALRNRPPLPTG